MNTPTSVWSSQLHLLVFPLLFSRFHHLVRITLTIDSTWSAVPSVTLYCLTQLSIQIPTSNSSSS